MISPVGFQRRRTRSRSTLRPELGRIVLGCLCLVGTNAFSLAIPWLLKQCDRRPPRRWRPPVAHGIVVRDAVAIIVFAVAPGADPDLVANLHLRRRPERRVPAAPRPVRPPDPAGPRVLPAPPDRRRHVAADERPRRGARAVTGPGCSTCSTPRWCTRRALALLLQLSPRLTLLALIPYPLLLVAARLASRRIHRASRAIQDQLGTMSTAIQEDLAGIAVIKHYTLEESRQRAFRGVNDEYLARALSLVRARGALMPLFAMLGGIGTLIVLWAGGREVIAGRMTRRQPGGVQRLPGAAVVADVRARLDHRDLAARHRRLGARARAARDAAGWRSLGRARRRRCRRRRPPATPHAVGRGARSGDRGRRAAAAGRRLVRAAGGRDAGDRRAHRRRARRRWSTPCCACRRSRRAPCASAAATSRASRSPTLRGMIGYAPQDAFLFSATVADNIAFGIRGEVDAAARDERVRRAAEAAGLAPDVAVLPDGLRDPGRRARHHPVGRAAAARGAGARAGRRPADPDPRRLAVVGRRRDRARRS